MAVGTKAPLAFALVLWSATALCGATCPTSTEEGSWMAHTSSTGATKCLAVSTEAMTYTECQEKFCGKHNATLVCVGSHEENEFVHSMLVKAAASHDTWGGWIGFHEGIAEGHWGWTSECSSDFTAWYAGEPNNYCMDEDCALLAPKEWGTQWVDAACGTKASCVCESGTHLAASYTEEVIAELKRGDPIGYDQCDENKKAAKKTGWFRVTAVLLLLGVLASNAYIIYLAKRSSQQTQPPNQRLLAEQGLVEYHALAEANGNGSA